MHSILGELVERGLEPRALGEGGKQHRPASGFEHGGAGEL